MGGPGPAKKAPSVGFVYFCIPHETKKKQKKTPCLNDKQRRDSVNHLEVSCCVLRSTTPLSLVNDFHSFGLIGFKKKI